MTFIQAITNFFHCTRRRNFEKFTLGYNQTIEREIEVVDEIIYIRAPLYKAFMETYRNEIQYDLRTWISKKDKGDDTHYNTKMYALLEIYILLLNIMLASKGSIVPNVIFPRGYINSMHDIKLITDHLSRECEYEKGEEYFLDRLDVFQEYWQEKPFYPPILKTFIESHFKKSEMKKKYV